MTAPSGATAATAATAECASGGAVAGDRGLAEFLALYGPERPVGSLAAELARIDAVGDEELEACGLGLARLHLHAVLGDAYSRAALAELAREVVRGPKREEARLWAVLPAIWRLAETHTRTGLDDPVFLAARHLDGWDVVLDAVPRRTPAILLMGRVGAYRMIPSDMLLGGYRFTGVGGPRAYPEVAGVRPERMPSLGRMLDATRPEAVVPMLRALRDGEALLTFLDSVRLPGERPGATFGDAGAEDAAGGGGQGYAVVDFLGAPTRVRAGMVRLAGRAGVPIGVLTAPRAPDGRASVRLVALARPPVLTGAALDAFVQTTTQAFYSALEAEVRAHPAQWSHWSDLHHWRAAGERASEAGSAVRAGARVRLVPRWAVPLRTPRGPGWAHARGLHCRLVPAPLAPMRTALDAGETVALAGALARPEALAAVAALVDAGLLEIVGAPAPGPAPDRAPDLAPATTRADARSDPG